MFLRLFLSLTIISVIGFSWVSLADFSLLQRVQDRLKKGAVIVRHGIHDDETASTLEGLEATFNLGADGNEIDVSQTKDGQLVLFEKPYLSEQAVAIGSVAQWNFDDIQRVSLLWAPGARIPSFREAALTHKKWAGLMILDVKDSNSEESIAQVLNETQAWDCVLDYWGTTDSDASERKLLSHRRHDDTGALYTPSEIDQYFATLNPLRGMDPRTRARVKMNRLVHDNLDFSQSDLQSTWNSIKTQSLNAILVNDPRFALLLSGRLNTETPLFGLALPPARTPMDTSRLNEILKTLNAAPLSNDHAFDLTTEKVQSDAARNQILTRAQGAVDILNAGQDFFGPTMKSSVKAALVATAKNRNFHFDWSIESLDAAMALRTLINFGYVTDVLNLVSQHLTSGWHDPRLTPIRDLNFPGESLPSTEVFLNSVAIREVASFGLNAMPVYDLMLAKSGRDADEVPVNMMESAARSSLFLIANSNLSDIEKQTRSMRWLTYTSNGSTADAKTFDRTIRLEALRVMLELRSVSWAASLFDRFRN